jgi:hypothetical protein
MTSLQTRRQSFAIIIFGDEWMKTGVEMPDSFKILQENRKTWGNILQSVVYGFYK